MGQEEQEFIASLVKPNKLTTEEAFQHLLHLGEPSADGKNILKLQRRRLIMGTLYTAINVERYKEMTQSKALPLFPVEDLYHFEFSEDKSFWVKRLTEQDDLEDVAAYRYSIIVEFEIDAEALNKILFTEGTGRMSTSYRDMYRETKHSEPPFPELTDNDVNVLALMDVFESQETADGVSQLWRFVVDSKESHLWMQFCAAVNKISLQGGIPGAVEEAE